MMPNPSTVPKPPLLVSQACGRASGLTLIELVMVMLAMAILASAGVMAAGNLGEQSDANMVATVQSSLQAVIGQGSARCGVTPSILVTNGNACNGSASSVGIVNAVTSRFPAGTVVLASPASARFQLTLPTGRGATYNVAANGAVTVNAITNFATYTVTNGTIR
jgi:prepilin-type N-terminal cleavage/methylation domain-containing protein